MWFVVIGTALVLMKWLEYGPVTAWSWWFILAPFAAAFAWWQFADSIGLTRKREMDKIEQRKDERRQKNMEALGLDWRRDKRVRVFKDHHKRQAEQEEAEREAKRKKDKETVNSGFGPKVKASGHATDEDTRLE